MTLQERFAGKGGRRYTYRVVTGTAAGAGMADMAVAVVLYFQVLWRQGRVKAFADAGDAVVHGSVFLKGLTVTLWYTPPAR